MKATRLRWIFLGGCIALSFGLLLHADEPPRTGPATEKRFPPLKVPPGFKATLFACDPLIEYPSAMCAGPRPGAVFVAVDYVTGLGVEIVRRDEIRLVEDTDGDGYADRATVVAGGFNSIQGLAYHDGTLFVMHAPFLSALKYPQGARVAEERRDLLTGLGLPPEKNSTRLHCANGVTVGHDGWLYLALGDNGVDVRRPEGDRLVLHGGGILRCRPDGRDLHGFATGLRNIYDVALDAELNVFVRDNENDGGTYKIRVCHSFWGADHGYPYLYEERPAEALPPLADLGLGSSAGGVCYLEPQFPPEYQSNLFFCEWGRAVVRYHPRRAGSAFGPVKETEFAAGAANDPYGFKPTDLVVQSDGTLMVSDWADGQRPKRGRGRIYHIASIGNLAKQPVSGKELARLDSPSYSQRCQTQAALERQGLEVLKALKEANAKGEIGPLGRLHAVWIIARLKGPAAIDDLLGMVKGDGHPAVRAQAVRAVADLADPVFVQHKLDARRGDADLATRLAGLAKVQDQRVVLEIVIALGRLRWRGAADWLRQNLAQPDATLSHAAMQTLRRCENWPAVLQLLDLPEKEPIREIAFRALADRFEPVVVDGLIERLRTAGNAIRRREVADALARVYKKPGTWVYWGYRPGPRPANTAAWERTAPIEKALAGLLADPERAVRLDVLRRMQREKIPVPAASLDRWLREENHPEPVAAILVSLRDLPAGEARPLLEGVIRNSRHGTANRKVAFALFARGLDKETAGSLLELAKALEDGPVLAEVLRQLAHYPRLPGAGLLKNKIQSAEAEVRAAAMETLAELRLPEGREPVLPLLEDKDARVRRAAAGAAGKLAERRAIEPLLKLARDPDVEIRRACLDSLRQLREPRVVPLAVASLEDRRLAMNALECLAELGSPDQVAAVGNVARQNPSGEIPIAAVRVLTVWHDAKGRTVAQQQALDRTVAEIHGSTGALVRWNVHGPASSRDATAMVEPLLSNRLPDTGKAMFGSGTEARVSLAPKGAGKDVQWLVTTEIAVSDPTPVEFLGSSSGSLQVWLNGKVVYRRDRAGRFQLDADRFAGTLVKGTNRLLVQVGTSPAAAEFHLRFRRKSAKGEHERLTQLALARPGNAERGRRLFLDVEKSQCLKCHRLGEQGERIGPELTGIGSRFSRIYIVESILEPSRTIAPSFGTRVVVLKNGKVVSGVPFMETETTLSLADNQGQKHVLTKADIDEQQDSKTSTMPEGLERRFTEEEFVDLIAFLANQKQERGP